MASQATLVQSGPTTREWLRRLRRELPRLKYSPAKHSAAFRARPQGLAVAYLHPSRQAIRVFLRLDRREHPRLQPSPSSSKWRARFPSVFRVDREGDLATAKRLILDSYAAATPTASNRAASRPDHFAPQELPSRAEYVEGSARQVLVNAYERNRRARETCLRHYGTSCTVCGLSFVTKYGKAAAGYIQVHHIVPIAQVGVEYRLDPVNDLRPVCPNCHAVIHRREPPFSIDDVKKMLRTSASGS